MLVRPEKAKRMPPFWQFFSRFLWLKALNFMKKPLKNGNLWTDVSTYDNYGVTIFNPTCKAWTQSQVTPAITLPVT
jgi:hypothetical protein